MLRDGEGIPEDESRAFELLDQAAKRGATRAQLAVGEMYEHGIATRKDPVMAAFWYRKAAEQGLDEARRRLDALEAAGP